MTKKNYNKKILSNTKIFHKNLAWNKHTEYIICELNRGISFWRKIRKNNKTLNRSIRTILFKQKYDIIKLFYKYLGILPLKQDIKLQEGRFIWKLNRQNLPNCLLHKFSLIHSQAINIANQKSGILTVLTVGSS